MSIYTSKVPHGIMFHYFHNGLHHEKRQGSISGEKFEAILNFIGIENILNPDEWLFKLINNKLTQNDLCITLDDGLKCQYDICLPVLEQYNLKSFWFIYSSVFLGNLGKLEIYSNFRSKYFISVDEFHQNFFEKYDSKRLSVIDKIAFEKYVNERKLEFPFYSYDDLKFRFIRDQVLGENEYEKLMDEIVEEKGADVDMIAENLWLSDVHLRTLSNRGHAIGLHSYSHPTVISKLSYKHQREEYKKNFRHLNQVCKKDVVSMSHPCNSYNNDTIKVLREFGILCGFRSTMIPPEGKKINPSTLEIAREDHSNILKKMQNE